MFLEFSVLLYIIILYITVLGNTDAITCKNYFIVGAGYITLLNSIAQYPGSVTKKYLNGLVSKQWQSTILYLVFVFCITVL